MSSIRIVLLLLLTAGCGAGIDFVRLASAGEPLRLTRVVLYPNGLAHFERRGRVETSTVDLRVPSAQVDDVLRSLTIVDGSDAAITGVRMLPSDEGDDVTLRVGLSQGAARDLTISYVSELPGFRPTYRIVVQDDDRVHVQGLAVVDNPTSEPWSDVALTLSTEVPLSFQYDVRSAPIVNRPRFDANGRLVRDELADSMHRTHRSGDNNINVAYGMAQAGQPRISTRAGQLIGGSAELDDEPAGTSSSNALLAFEQRPEGAEGVFAEMEGFDLGRGESGLVPFVDTGTAGRMALLYKPAPGGSLSASHPYRAVMFENPTDAPLLTGPVSLYAADRFVGDGVSGTVAAGAHAFVPYAIERSVTVQATDERAEDEIRATHLAGGLLTVELRAVARRRFRVSSTHTQDRPVYVFAPAIEGYEPRDLSDGSIRTSQGYFLRAELDERGGSTVVFDQVRRHSTRVNIASDPDHDYVSALLAWLDDSEDTARLRTIADRLTAIDEELDTHAEDLQVERAALAERRAGVEALRDVGSSGALRQRLAQAVADGVSRVDTITRTVSALHAEQISLEQEWYARLRTLTAGQ